MLTLLDKLDPTKADWKLTQLLLAPIMGALFLVFLPLIGFYLLIEMVVQRTIEIFTIPVPVPGNSYLTGSEPAAKKEPRGLEALEKEIADKRK